MEKGRCRLCNQVGDLQDSHVWPSFVYKDYVSDQSLGGQFVDFLELERRNHQYTHKWFCNLCEVELSKIEAYGKQLMKRIERNQDVPHDYDERLLPFIVSISYRTTMNDLDVQGGRVPPGLVAAPLGRWREHLIDFFEGRKVNSRRPAKVNVKPYSQHLFVVFGQTVDYHKGLGGQIFPMDGLVHSQIGPFTISGLTHRKGISVPDLRVWNRSEVSALGGTISAVKEWRVPSNITAKYAKFLKRHEIWVTHKAKEFAIKNGE
jgi:hypothetical protein